MIFCDTKWKVDLCHGLNSAARVLFAQPVLIHYGIFNSYKRCKDNRDKDTGTRDTSVQETGLGKFAG